MPCSIPNKYVSCTLVILFSIGAALSQDYYWRPFNGVIPEDALIGHVNGETKTYIGNAYVYDVGIVVGQVFDGRNEILLTGGVEYLGQVYTRTRNIKVLCTEHPENFEWVLTNRTLFTSLDYNFVLGGVQSKNEGNLYIGKLDYQGVRIGKIDGYFATVADIYVADDRNEISTVTYTWFSFEVLIYVDKSSGYAELV